MIVQKFALLASNSVKHTYNSALLYDAQSIASEEMNSIIQNRYNCLWQTFICM